MILGLMAGFCALWSLAGCRTSSQTPQRVVLVTIDTLRADHVGFGGHPLPITPFLDSLAEQGVVFPQALAPAPTTGPSHASIFTGLYPIQHRVQANGQKLDPVYLTLAEAFLAAGFQTAAFVSTNAHFRWGDLSQGFEVYDEQPLPASGEARRKRSDYRPAAETIDAAIAWLGGRDSKEPLFLWIHLYDPHKPLHPPEEDKAAVQAMIDELGVDRYQEFLRAAHGNPDQPEVFDAIALYDAEVRYVDRQLARLHEALGEDRVSDLWVVTSDHGQGLYSHDGWLGHAWQIYEVQMRVPLVFHFTDGGPRPGVIENQLVELIDLAPTLAEIFGFEFRQRLGDVQGVSLWSTMQRSSAAPVKGYSLGQNSWYRRQKSDRPNQSLRKTSIRTHDRKLIVTEGGDDELYDLSVDPNERDNLIDSPQLAAEKERLRVTLERLVESLENLEIDPESVDDATLERLRALGYLQ